MPDRKTARLRDYRGAVWYEGTRIHIRTVAHSGPRSEVDNMVFTLSKLPNRVETSALVGTARSVSLSSRSSGSWGRTAGRFQYHGCIPLPATTSKSIARELLPGTSCSAERQLVNRRQNQDAVTVEVLTPVT